MTVWIARDADGGLFMFSQKPEREDKWFVAVKNKPEPLSWWELPENLFPEVTWGNSPKTYELVMKFKEPNTKKAGEHEQR